MGRKKGGKNKPKEKKEETPIENESVQEEPVEQVINS